MTSRTNRRQLIGLTTGAVLATTAASLFTSTATAQSATAEATAVAGTRSLDPSSPESLGIPPIPDATVSTAANAVSYETATAPYAEFGTDAAPGVFPREVRHAFGTTTIETQPERVVVLDSGELDAAIFLGIIPVGAAEYLASGLPRYVADRVEGITLVGTTAEPDLEAIIALQPDLILSSKLRHDEDMYNRLSQIAPTVFAERPGVTFKQNFKLYAQALGREIAGSELIQKYETGCREANAQLPVPRPTTSIVQIRPDGVRYYQRANFLGVVLTDLGFPRNNAENVDDFAFDGSLENLGEYANGELLLLAVQSDKAADMASTVTSSDVWQTLPAVQNDGVFEVPSDTFIGGIGYGAAIDVVNTMCGRFGIDPVIDLS
jgi:iron complex transport system substrate-binding protein